MVLFQFSTAYPHRYEGEYRFPFGESEEQALRMKDGLTTIPPPEIFAHPHIHLCFEPTKQQWVFREIYVRIVEETNTLDDVLDYKELRKLEYPTESEYFDAQSKGDDAQLIAYFQKCIAVKQKYPKQFRPITRRSYLVKTIGLVTDKAFETFVCGEIRPNENFLTLSHLNTSQHKLKDDIDTLKVARTLAKSEISKLKNSIIATNKRIDDLPAYEIQVETETIKANLRTTNERLQTLANSLDMVIAVLKKKYIL